MGRGSRVPRPGGVLPSLGFSMAEAISRRELLQRGGALALASSAASLGSLRVARRQRVRCDLAAQVHLARDAGLVARRRPSRRLHDLGQPRVRDESGTKWVKPWMSCYDLQQELGAAPGSRVASSQHLNTAPSGQSWLRRLDRQVKAIQDDGLGAILTVYHTFPTWSSDATGVDPVGGRKAAEQKLPANLAPTGHGAGSSPTSSPATRRERRRTRLDRASPPAARTRM
jgi:hypothetical protein